MVNHQRLAPNHVGNRDHRKIESPGGSRFGINISWADGSHAAAEDIDADHEIPPGVDGLPRPHHIFPPALFAGQRVRLGQELVTGQRVAD